MQPNRKWTGRLLILAAAILWSSSGFFAKAPIFDEWPVESRGTLLAFWRALFASAVLIFMVRKVEWTWRLVVGSIVFAAMNWAFLSSMTYAEATLTIWLQYTAPVWVVFGSWYLFKEKPEFKEWILFATSMIGVSVIVLPQLVGAETNGLLLGLLSGLFFGGVVLSLRWMRELDSAWIIFFYHAVTALAFLPALLTNDTYPSGQQWIYLACFGALQMGIPYVLFARGLKAISSHEAAGISLLEPVLVPLWVFVAWRHHADYEPPAIYTIAGGIFILAGLVFRYLNNKQSDAPSELSHESDESS